MSLLTIYQAQYYAYELTRKFSSSNSEKLNLALFDAQVELNPHQIEAALFALHSPLSKGAILADEVGLGKTIEAGILLSQFWAEKKQRLLIICPANLRKQWEQELFDKFFLESHIVETKNIKSNKSIVSFDTSKIIICSYEFSRIYADSIQLQKWDLVIIDEAHRLRNVYKASNKLGNTLKNALKDTKKILLTATPLQNNLLELYGLVSIIDEKIFGDERSFKSKFIPLNENEEILRERLKPIAIRNLRHQVQEYVKYTNRIPLTIKFEPTEEEQLLYNYISTYLQQDQIYALPKRYRNFITLVIRKLLASSSFALAPTISSLITKLEYILINNNSIDIAQEILDDYELYDEYQEYEDENNNETSNIENNESLNDKDIALIQKEINDLKEYYNLAISIETNAKGNKLLTALEQGFLKLNNKAEKKAIIFTESRRTQEYLFQLLNTHYPNKVITFNGSNNDELCIKIYNDWFEKHKYTNYMSNSKTADIRAALVEYFRDDATIMIATEAAAEGINLQFCSLIINYDLPWNPQRIEQRIGRCHRYGQKYDVVVVNFINQNNAADIRIFELLEQKFNLFNGVFGASDEILGSIENGLDFEKNISKIYDQCRTIEEINQAFDKLQDDAFEKINNKMIAARKALFSNFDEDVASKLKQRLTESKEYLNKYQEWLWEITKFQLKDTALFDDAYYTFELKKQPFINNNYPLYEKYALGKNTVQPHIYRIQNPLAQQVLSNIKDQKLSYAHLTFSIQGINNTLEPFRNSNGWLSLISISIQSLEESEYIIPFGATNDNKILLSEEAQKLLCLPATIQNNKNIHCINIDSNFIKIQEENEIKRIQKLVNHESSEYFKERKEQIYNWSNDKIRSAEIAVEEIRKQLKQLKREAHSKSEGITEMLKYEKEINNLESKLQQEKQEYSNIEDTIMHERKRLIEEIEKKISDKITTTAIFTITWNLV